MCNTVLSTSIWIWYVACIIYVWYVVCIIYVWVDKGYIVGGVSERVSQVNYLPELYMAIKIFKSLSIFRAKLLDIALKKSELKRIVYFLVRMICWLKSDNCGIGLSMNSHAYM